MDPLIMAALIAAVGAVLAALIGFVAVILGKFIAHWLERHKGDKNNPK